LLIARIDDAPKTVPEQWRSPSESHYQDRTNDFVLSTILGENKPVFVRGSGYALTPLVGIVCLVYLFSLNEEFITANSESARAKRTGRVVFVCLFVCFI
jgi:hypothetical protein